MEIEGDAINRREQARAMRHPHPRRFLPAGFSARTAPVLWTFERGSRRRDRTLERIHAELRGAPIVGACYLTYACV
jgi:hypothetical protein